jgi:recombination protein RecA
MAKEKEKRSIPKNLNELKKTIWKEHGEGAVLQGRSEIVRVDSFPSGIASIDRAFGCGGIPQGRVIELFGLESSGKTTTCLHLIEAAQKHHFKGKGRKGVAAIVDAEHAFDPAWAEKIGVDTEALLISQPNSGEEALDIVERMAESGLVDLIVVDSVAALVPKAELDGEMGGNNMGMHARLMSQAMRKLTAKSARSKTTIIFINQIRQKIGVMFGNPETTTGGLALKFYASVRMQIIKGSAVKDGTETIAFSPYIKFLKNKVAPPFTRADFDICFGHPKRPVNGIDKLACLLDEAITTKVVELKGSNYNYGDVKLGAGKTNTLKFLRENDAVREELSGKIYNAFAESVHVVSSGDDDELADGILDEDGDE